MMGGAITGYVVDAVTGEALSALHLHLYRHGVLGETPTQADELGHFAFRSLPPGSYSLGIHDGRYAPLYRKLILEEGDFVENLELRLTPGAFIKGQILDEDGEPPQRCHFSLIRAGNRRGREGYISDSGAHEVDEDGRFSSPPLHPGRYFLRLAGILKQPSGVTPQSTHSAMQQRIFDFLYPNAQNVSDAAPFDVQTGEIMTDLELRIPRPIWYTVRGKLTGTLPEDIEHLYVHFTRDVGMLDESGSLGVKVDSSGVFEGPAQPGRYRLSVSMTKEFGSAEVTVGAHDVDGLEIQIDPATGS
jgi:Carboxypeptidase regulatory-like domain